MESMSHDNHGDDGSSSSPSASGSELFVENENLAIEGEHQSAVDKHGLKKNGTDKNESKEKKQSGKEKTALNEDTVTDKSHSCC